MMKIDFEKCFYYLLKLRMCIFSGIVRNVSKTKIACVPLSRRLGGKLQIVVYQNDAELDKRGGQAAMILPFPNGRSYFPVKNLENNKDFFGRIEKAYRLYKPVVSRSKGMSNHVHGDRLEIERVGSYFVSIAHDIDELAQLDFGAFSIDPNVVTLLSKRYGKSTNFGFIICQLEPGKRRHPIAYGHSVTDDNIFFPTYHYHSSDDGHVTADWDHNLYAFNVDRSSVSELVDYSEVMLKHFQNPIDLSLKDKNLFNEISEDIDPMQFFNCCKIDIIDAPNMDIIVKQAHITPVIDEKINGVKLDKTPEFPASPASPTSQPPQVTVEESSHSCCSIM